MTKTEEPPKNHLSLFSAVASGAALVLSIVALFVALCGGHDGRHEGHHYKMGPHYEMRGEPGGMERGYNPRDLPQAQSQSEMGEGSQQPDFKGQP